MTQALGWPGRETVGGHDDAVGWPGSDDEVADVSRETSSDDPGAAPAAPLPDIDPEVTIIGGEVLHHLAGEPVDGTDSSAAVTASPSGGGPDHASGVSRETSPPSPQRVRSPLDDLPSYTASPAETASPSGSESSVAPQTYEEALQFGSDHVSRETTTTALAQVDAWPLPTSCRVITIANQKGGVGKTTSAVNVAACLAQHGARVLVIDLDPQGNASTAFGIDHREGVPSVYDVLVDGAAIADVALAVAGFEKLDCVPATIDVAGAEVELVSVVARETRLRRAVSAVEANYDYVFIDCPPSLGLLTLNALVACREVMIPIQCEFYALEGLSQLLRNIELVRSHLNEKLVVSTILLTMFDARTKLADQVATDVRQHFGPLVIGVTIPRSVRISEAPGFGQTIVTFDPASRGATAYRAAAHELAERASASAPPSTVATTDGTP
jgi:chromosome partitioning protein